MLPIVLFSFGAERWIGPRYATNFRSRAAGHSSIMRRSRRLPRAQQALAEWAADMAENGDVHEHRWLKRIEVVRELAGRLLNADPADLAFIKNTTDGIGLVAEGFPWKPGDNVVTAAEEYPSNIYPWLNLADRGVEIAPVASRGNRIEIGDIRDAMDSRTRLVSLSFVEYASGFRNDLNAIGTLCRQRGAYFFVDAIQGLGILPLDVRQVPIDFLAADGHKWLLGPEGTGIFYCRRELLDLLHPLGVGWNSVVGARDFSRTDFRLKPNAGRWEGGTYNVAGITALGASLELLLHLGISRIAERVHELTEHLCQQVQQAGFEVFSSRQKDEWSGHCFAGTAWAGCALLRQGVPARRHRHQSAGRADSHQPPLLQHARGDRPAGNGAADRPRDDSGKRLIGQPFAASQIMKL